VLVGLARPTQITHQATRVAPAIPPNSEVGLTGVLVTVLSPAPIGSVLRRCSGGTRFAGALDSAIDRRSANGEQFA